MNQPDDQSSAPLWMRDTRWRQGTFLSLETATAFGIAHVDATDLAVVVISHDCDIAQSAENEPFVEALVGTFIDSLDGNYTHGKNVRTLHLECTGGGSARSVALTIVQKVLLAKEATCGQPCLAEHQPLDTILMAPQEKRVLQLWLASRYHRAAFPDEFDRRLSSQTGVKERLAKVLRDSGKHIAAMFFDIDEGIEIQRDGEGDIYSLFITLMYSTTEAPAEAEQIATQVADRIREIFNARCKGGEVEVESWRWIELLGVEVIADNSITVAQSQMLSKWHGDYISLRTDPPQALFTAR